MLSNGRCYSQTNALIPWYLNILESGLINKKESPCPAGLEFFIKNIHIYTGAMGATEFKYFFKIICVQNSEATQVRGLQAFNWAASFVL